MEQDPFESDQYVFQHIQEFQMNPSISKTRKINTILHFIQQNTPQIQTSQPKTLSDFIRDILRTYLILHTVDNRGNRIYWGSTNLYKRRILNQESLMMLTPLSIMSLWFTIINSIVQIATGRPVNALNRNFIYTFLGKASYDRQQLTTFNNIPTYFNNAGRPLNGRLGQILRNARFTQQTMYQYVGRRTRRTIIQPPGFDRMFMFQSFQYLRQQQNHHLGCPNPNNWRFDFLSVIPQQLRGNNPWILDRGVEIPQQRYWPKILNYEYFQNNSTSFRSPEGYLRVDSDILSNQYLVCGPLQVWKMKYLLFNAIMYYYWGIQIQQLNRDKFARSYRFDKLNQLKKIKFWSFFQYTLMRHARTKGIDFQADLSFLTNRNLTIYDILNFVNRNVQLIIQALNKALFQSRYQLDNYAQQFNYAPQQQQRLEQDPDVRIQLRRYFRVPYNSLVLRTNVWPINLWGVIRFRQQPTLLFFQALQTRRIRVIHTNVPRQWNFWARRNKVKWQQYFDQESHQCVAAIRALFPSFPDLKWSIDPIGQVIQWCNMNGQFYYIVGYPQQSPQWKKYVYNKKGQLKALSSRKGILISPGHIEYTQIKNPHPKKYDFGTTIHYNSDHSRYKINQHIPATDKAVKLQQDDEYQIGKPLPTLFNRLRFRTMVIDIQSLSVKQKCQSPYMLCFVGYPQFQALPVYMCFSNIQEECYNNGQKTNHPTPYTIEQQICIIRFVCYLRRIQHLYTAKEPLYIWGFNMMGYEINYLGNVLSRIFGKINHIGPLNQCKKFSIAQNKIIFLDIMKIVNGSLQSTSKAFQLPIKKLEKQQFDIKTIDTWQKVTDNYQTIKRYCYYDCVATYLLVEKIQGTFCQIAHQLKVTLYQQQVKRMATASTIGWWFFVNCFYRKNLLHRKPTKEVNFQYILDQQPQQVYKKQRQSYFGGVVQVYKYICQFLQFYIDINSMYPFIMTGLLPWKYIKSINIQNNNYKKFLQDQNFDLYLCQVTYYELPNSYKGALIATKDQNGKNVYFNSYSNKKKPIYIRGITVKRLLQRKGKINIIKLHVYQHDQNALQYFSQTFYKMRVQKGKSNPAMKQCLKLLMNSVTGRLSMTEKKSYITSNYPLWDQYDQKAQNMFQQQSEASLPGSGRLVRLTAYITEKARIYLQELAFKAGFDNVSYTDTDSLIVNQQGYRRLGSPKQTATQLGEFKCERVLQRGYFINRKCYIMEVRTNQGLKLQGKLKGFPKRFLNNQILNSVIDRFKQKVNQAMFKPYGTVIPLDINIQMEVWRKKVSQGVVINHMSKTIQIITDRYMINSKESGYPQNPLIFNFSFTQQALKNISQNKLLNTYIGNNQVSQQQDQQWQ